MLNTGLSTASKRLGCNNIPITAFSSTLISLTNDNAYLVSIENNYNVGDLFFVQTGSSANSGKCSVAPIISNGYFTLEPINTKSFYVKAGNADGILNALQLAK